MLNNPLLLDVTLATGIILPVTGDPGSLAGLTLLALDGPGSAELSLDGATWAALSYPHTLAAGEQLRLIRTDTGPTLSVLRATLAQEGGLRYLGQVASASALPGGAQVGDTYSTQDTHHLHTWDGTVWVDNGPVGVPGTAGQDGTDGRDGMDGADGLDGAAATVQIGTVTTGAPGSAASVTNSGTPAAAVLNFTIPRGADGADGEDGTPGGGGSSSAAFLSGTAADRPTTSTTGTHYLALDSGKLWKWAGAWVLAGTLLLAGAEGALVRENALPGRTYTFSTYASGAVAGQFGWSGPGTVSGGVLQVGNAFSTLNGPQAPGTFAEGEVLALVDRSNPHLLIRANHATSAGRAYAVWLYNGPNGLTLDTGVLNATGVVVSSGSGPTLASGSDPIYLRLVVERKRLLAWAWPSTSQMPTEPMLIFDVGSYPLGDGVTLLSYTAAQANVRSLRLQDGTAPPNALQVQARFIGRWWTAYRSGRQGMATITQGAELRLHCDGSDLTALVYRDPDTTQTPYFSVRVGGGDRVRVAGPTTSGWSTVTLASGLSGKNDVSVVLDALHELDPTWDAAALLIGGLSSAGGTTVPLVTGQAAVVHVSDSIGAGVLLLGSSGGTSTANSAASLAYTRLATAQAGAESVTACYGGVGVAASTAGSGGVPGALGNQLAYHARHLDLDPYAADVRVVTVNLGTNDNTRGISSATFRADYDSLLGLLKSRYPAAKILALRPFSGVYAAEIQAAATAAGSRVQYVDTSGWVSTYTDGTHPDQAGHAAAAAQLAPLVQAALT